MKTLVWLLAMMITPLFCAVSTAAYSNQKTDPLTDAIQLSRLPIDHQGGRFSGTGYDWLVQQGQQAQYFLIGEEHGIAENPLLAAQLFESLSTSGYQHLAIEVSPPMAQHLDKTLQRGGLEALKASYSLGTEPAFFGMTQEATLLDRVRKASKHTQAFWGLDYEVAGDKVLIDRLADLSKPVNVEPLIQTLKEASDSAWQKYQETNSPEYIFSFSGDPALVKHVIDEWPNRADEASQILNSLFETLSINQDWINGNGYLSNQRRAQLFRNNFVSYWRNAPMAKVMVKLGASHVMRGLNSNGAYDVGSLIPALSVVNQTESFSVLVLPGEQSQVAVLDPTVWRYQSAPAKDGYSEGLKVFFEQVYQGGFSVFDLAPLRALVRNKKYRDLTDVKEVVNRFDALIIMTGSTASDQLVTR